MSAELRASRREATLILTLSNPAAKNALHPDIYAAAIETLTTAERDDSIGAVILTGADQLFCCGDERALEGHGKEQFRQAKALENLHGWIDAIRDCPKPVIAAVEGIAADAGFALALACDLIVAGASAEFSLSQVESGSVPEGGAAWFLLRSLPRQVANEILLGGESMLAPRLKELGIVNRVTADGSALDLALTWAGRLAKLPSNAVERVKALAQTATGQTLAQHFDIEKRSLLENA